MPPLAMVGIGPGCGCHRLAMARTGSGLVGGCPPPASADRADRDRDWPADATAQRGRAADRDSESGLRMPPLAADGDSALVVDATTKATKAKRKKRQQSNK